MFRESTPLEFRNHFTDNISIPVAAFLNSKGGTLVMGAYGPKFQNEDDVTTGIKKIINRLFTDISDFSTNLVSFTHFPMREKVFIIVIEVDHSSQLHFIKRNGIDIYYFRQSHKNVGFKKEDAERKRLNAKYGIKIIEPAPIDDGLGQFFKIGHYPSGSYYYKYMSLESALQCLEHSTLRFAEPTSWPDKYEGHFYKAEIKGTNSSSYNPPLFGCCFTYRKDNEAAWKLYSYDKKGLDSRCVEFKLDKIVLRKKLKEWLSNPSNKYTLYEGCVEYLEAQKIDNLPKPLIKRGQDDVPNELHHAFFDNFSLEKYLNLMLLKRNAFLHEQEVRFLLVPNDYSNFTKTESEPVDIHIDWSDIIIDIRIDAHSSKYEQGLLQNKLIEINSSVELEPFDVYNSKRETGIKI